MHAACSPASRTPPRAARAGPPRCGGPPFPEGLVATWRWRMRYRAELYDKAATAPHLVDDMGLTLAELEAEIAKPFWQR